MRLHVLGSSGTYPAAGRPGSGFLVAAGDRRVMLDCGPGTFVALCAVADPTSLDAVVVSHIHADHSVDVFALFHALAYGPGRPDRLPLYAPEGAADHLAAFTTDGDRFESVFDPSTVGDGDRATHGELTMVFAAASHSVPAIATRVESAGRSLVYSGDTGPEGGFDGLCAGADLVVAEASYQGAQEDHDYPYHLAAATAGAIARGASAGRLMLTHLRPTLDPARSVEEAEATFGRPVELAVPGLETDV